MTSPFSSEQLVFLQRFVTSIVRSMVGEDSRTEHKVEPKTKINAKPITKPMAKPMEKPIAKTIVKPMAKPMEKPMAKPIVKPTAKPTAKPISNPITKPTVKHESKPKAKPEVKTKPSAELKAKSKVEIEPKVEVKATSKPKGRIKRKLRAPTEQSSESSPSPKIKKPKASHDVASTEPSKPHIPIVSRNPAPKILKENYSGLRTDIYRVCLRCSQVGHLDDDCRAVIPAPTHHPNPLNPYLAPCREIVPFNPHFVYAAPHMQRFGCSLCGDSHHDARVCPYERNVGLVRDPHRDPEHVRVSANPSPEFKGDQAKANQKAVNK